MTTMTDQQRPRTAPRRRRWVRRLVITLAVLLGLTVVADFSAAAIFEYQVSKRARNQFNLADDPSVKVGGFSFLAQAVSGEYDRVSIDARGVPVRDTLRDLEVHIELMGVQAPLGDLVSGSLKEVKVREVEGQVRVKASDVSRALHQIDNPLLKSLTNLTIDPVTEQDARTDPDDRTEEEQEAAEAADELETDDDTTAGARLCASTNIGGDETDFCAFGIISLVDAKATFLPTRMELRNEVLGVGELSDEFQASLLSGLTGFTLDPGELPFTVTPTAIDVSPGVLSVKGKATNVVLGGSG